MLATGERKKQYLNDARKKVKKEEIKQEENYSLKYMKKNNIFPKYQIITIPRKIQVKILNLNNQTKPKAISFKYISKPL